MLQSTHQSVSQASPWYKLFLTIWCLNHTGFQQERQISQTNRMSTGPVNFDFWSQTIVNKYIHTQISRVTDSDAHDFQLTAYCDYIAIKYIVVFNSLSFLLR